MSAMPITIKECLKNRHLATIAKDVSRTSHEDGQYGIVMTWTFPRKIYIEIKRNNRRSNENGKWI